MLYNFDSKERQVSYISKFVRRYTDIDLKCQFCGNEGRIRNNFSDPYKIQIVCLECKKKNLVKKEGMYENIPLIDIKKHLIKDRLKYIYLNDDVAKKIKNLTKTRLTKCIALKSVGLSNKNTFEKIITEYERLYDKDIRSKLNKVFKENRCNKAKQVSIGTEAKESKNNIAKYKLQKGLTNRDIHDIIYAKYGINVYNNTVSNLSKGKQNCTPKVRCLIAEALGVSLGDLFEEYKPLNIKTYNDYLELNNKVRSEMEYAYISKPLNYIAKQLKISENIIYAFYNGVTNLSLDNLLIAVKYFKL